MMNGLIIIPAFNEGKVISKVIKGIPGKINDTSFDILIVNDGSTDDTLEEASKTSAMIISHLVNRGTGAATKTGLMWAREKNYSFAITFDADGQHDPTDLGKIVEMLSKNDTDLVVGSRLKKSGGMPKDRFLINWLANILTLLVFGVFSSDSQSGLKGFSRRALELIDFRGDRYDFSSEILLSAKRHNLVVKEIPTKVIYTEYSRKKGQQNSNVFYMGRKLIMKLFT